MHDLIREEHHIKSGMGAKFIAQHLSVRTRYGKAVIVVHKPHPAISAKKTLRAFMKNWSVETIFITVVTIDG